MFEGEGTLKFVDSSTYSGSWKFGLMHGRGTLRNVNGEVFIGQFVNGRKHGKGVLTTKTAAGKFERIEGIWDHDSLKERL